MAEEIHFGEDKISLGGSEFNTSDLSSKARGQVDNIKFVNEQIQLKNNELQIADTARLMYFSVLRSNLAAEN